MHDITYDLVVIGSGPGGYVAAIKAGQKGKKVAIIEKENWGGVCLNIGCIPTKALLKSAKVFSYLEHASDYGIDVTGAAPNWEVMQKRKSGVVKQLTGGVEYLLKKNNVDRFIATARAIDKNTIEIDDKGNKKILKTKNLIIATGSVSRNLNLDGFKEAKDEQFLITSRQALALKKIPKELIVIGGGVIGVEFACLYSALGTKVTIVQGLNKILEVLDDDVSKTMTAILIKKGINIVTDAKILAIKDKTLIYEKDNKEQKLKSEKILISVGRVPVLDGFENLGLAKDETNKLIVNDQFKTNIEGVYAIGDVLGKKMLAHVASAQAIVAISDIIGEEAKMSSHIPSCIYTFPEVAAVGLTEAEAKKMDFGDNLKIFKFPFAVNGKALCEGETDGFVKLIVDNKYGEILGAHIVGATATDMITEITTLMESEGTIHELASTIHPHPTLSEALFEAAEGIIDKPIHI